MRIPIILGTAREGRYSEKASNFLFSEIKKKGVESEIIDVRDYLFQFTNNRKSLQYKVLSEKIIKSDAIIIVSPEYNHGYPGELKIMLDILFKEYKGKPVGICGVSSGKTGGARAIEQLRQVVINFSMIPIREAIYFSEVETLFDKEGNIKEKIYYEHFQSFFAQLKNSI